MQEFLVYLKLGINHILDWQGYDHLLFIAAMTWVYRVRHISKLIYLVSAFTLGHSITLALAVIGWVPLPSEWIEALIPLTLIGACISNLFFKLPKAGEPNSGHSFFRFGLVFFFGLIHGLGFSNYLKSLLFPNDELWRPLLGFNLGIEVAQFLLVALVLAINTIGQDLLVIKKKEWIAGGSFLIMGLSLSLFLEKLKALIEVL